MSVEARPAAYRSSFLNGLDVQRHVLGALMMRELHTRYGRENIGYLWMIAEPALLAGAVAAIHMTDKNHHGSDLRSVPFALAGYVVFMMFRSVMTRSEGAIDANKSLFFHRMVTLYDVLTARAILEGATTVATYTVLITLATAAGAADLPARPVMLLAGIGLLLWFVYGISMLIAASSYDNKLVSKFVHPMTYLIMPASGAFFELQWLPEPYRTYLSYFPMTQIFELVRYGQFNSASLAYVRPAYLIGWNLVLLFLGLLALRVVRRRIHL
jgi:capsular polysaccharide transport system permease protein